MVAQSWSTAITDVHPNSVRLRGYPIDQLMGRISYAQAVYLALRGELPGEATGRLIDAMLVSSVDHGVTPPSVLTALTVASTGADLSACVASGVLAISRWHGGAIEACMHSLQAAVEMQRHTGRSVEDVAAETVREAREKKQRISGFGHRLHTRDPRTVRLFELASEAGRDGDYVKMSLAIEAVFEQSGKQLPLNVDGAMAAVLCELEFDPQLANAFFIMARVPGIVAHVYEERTRQRPMRRIDTNASTYDGPLPRDLETPKH
jgi:citrate synthase